MAIRNRLREPEARILVLRIAASHPGNRAPMEKIKDEVPAYIAFTPIDLKTSGSRPNENKWQQIVGNVVSHAPLSTSIFTKGYATLVGEDIQVTTQGLSYLKKLGF